jgi:DNA-binding phage protein
MTNVVHNEKSNTTLANNLEILMEKKNIKSFSELAKHMGVPSTTVYRLIDQGSNPTMSSLQKVSAFFGVSVSQLIGEDPILPSQKNSFNETEEKQIPLITFHEAVNLVKNNSITLDLNQEKYIKVDIELSRSAFGVIMKGNSMSPIFPDGTLLIFDPARDIYDQCYALVYLDKFQQCYFKQVCFSEPLLFIKSVKSETANLDLIKLEDNDRIIAILIQSKTTY